MSNEVYDCAGCGGEVSVVEAVWLPVIQKGAGQAVARDAKPYCCAECYMDNVVSRRREEPDHD